MAEEGGQGDRTLPATARRQQQAREQGQVPLSREVTELAVLGAGGTVLWLAGPMLTEATMRRIGFLMQQAFRLEPAQGAAAALYAVALAALPFALAAMVAAILATFAQTGLLIHGGALMPDLSRLSPLAGLKRVFGTHGLTEAAKGLLKLGILILAGRSVATSLLPGLPALLWHDPVGLPAALFAVILHLGLSGLCVQAVFAGADIGLTRWRHAQSTRMSREEIRQEHKDTEGDPAIRNRLKRLRMSRARRRMMAAVPTATLVVTNPTHYAVALFYQRAQGGAPKVVAKGLDHLALRIRETAQDHRVPVVVNPPLAHALYEVELDAEIPAEHFQAVAEIIAFIWGLDRRARPRL